MLRGSSLSDILICRGHLFVGPPLKFGLKEKEFGHCLAAVLVVSAGKEAIPEDFLEIEESDEDEQNQGRHRTDY